MKPESTNQLIVNEGDILKALLERAHAGASLDLLPYRVAVSGQIGRVIFADTPSLNGGYFANYKGESNYVPEIFLDEGNDYTWGEGPSEDPDLASEVAKEWIKENLLSVVELHGVEYKVKYQAGI